MNRSVSINSTSGEVFDAINVSTQIIEIGDVSINSTSGEVFDY